MRRERSLIGALVVLGLLAAAWPAQAAGIDDFKLARAIPAESMIVVATRSHEGGKFVEEQYQRIWAAIERQHFDRDIKKLIRAGLTQADEPVETFDEQWDRFMELAGKVGWSKLMAREAAIAIKIGAPPEFVILMMPPADQVAQDYDALAAMAKQLAELAPEEQVAFSAEGEGENALNRVTMNAGSGLTLTVTLARQKDALLLGFGSGLVEQSLGLLRGETGSTLIGTERFKAGMQRLPTPQDSFFFVDVSRIMGEARKLVDMLQEKMGATDEGGEVAETQPADVLKAVIKQVDLWDYMAGTAATEGMKTSGTSLVVLREGSKDLPLYRAFYGGKPLADPLKYVPKDATAVSAFSGFDLTALYKAVTDFIAEEVDGGEDLLTQWEDTQEELEFNLEQDLLGWLGNSFVSFSAARGSYASDFVFLVQVRDEQAARAALDKLTERLNEALAEQNAGVEDAELEGAEGFKLFVVPGPLALMLPVNQPVFGVKDGRLIFGSSSKIVETALAVAAGEQPNFKESERYKTEALPLPDNATGYSYSDLSKLGEQLSTAMNMMLLPLTMSGAGAKDPAMAGVLNMVRKAAAVTRALDFFKSSSEVTTFDGRASLTKAVINYQQPPPKPETTPEESPGKEGEPAKPEGEAEPAGSGA